LRWMRLALILAAAVVGATTTATASAASPVSKTDRALDRALRGLVGTTDGPPGAIAVIQRGDRRRVHAAGIADLEAGTPPQGRAQMRIASVAKAFSAATALALVDQGVLNLEDTIGERLPELPAQWHSVTLRQLLGHTSGLPDFSKSPAFRAAVTASPTVAPPPRDLLAFVAEQPLEFPPGSSYEYSNSDNIAAALMIEAATGSRYESALHDKVLEPLGLHQTSMPQGTLLPNPFIHGYGPNPPGEPDDLSQFVAFGGWAWASGGILSTPGNLNGFVRGYLDGGLFGQDVRGEQFALIDGASSEPRGPGQNAAGLGIFRYRTRCGTVFGHTGNTSGYTQLIAANRRGRRSLTFTINIQATDEILPELRKAQVRAVCAALARR